MESSNGTTVLERYPGRYPKGQSPYLTAEENKRLVRRLDIIDCYRRGIRNKNEIAQKVGCSPQTVANDLEFIREEYGEAAKQLAQQLDVERWIALSKYEHAQGIALEIAEDKEMRVEDRLKAIGQYTKAQDSINRLAGLNKPTKHAITNPEGDEEYGQIPEEFKKRALANARRQPKEEDIITVEAEVE